MPNGCSRVRNGQVQAYLELGRFFEPPSSLVTDKQVREVMNGNLEYMWPNVVHETMDMTNKQAEERLRRIFTYEGSRSEMSELCSDSSYPSIQIRVIFL